MKRLRWAQRPRPQRALQGRVIRVNEIEIIVENGVFAVFERRTV